MRCNGRSVTTAIAILGGLSLAPLCAGPAYAYSPQQCQKLLAQIREYQRVLPAYQAQGKGGLILRGIRANQAAYNSGCHQGGGYGSIAPLTVPRVYVPPSRAGQIHGAGTRARNELGGMSLDNLPGQPRRPKKHHPTKRRSHKFCDVLKKLKRVNFSREWRGAVARIKAYNELEGDLTKMRDKLKSEQNGLAGEGREAIATLGSVVVIGTDLVNNLEEFDPETKPLAKGTCVLKTAGVTIAEQSGAIATEEIKSGHSVLHAVRDGLTKLGNAVGLHVLKDCSGKMPAAAKTVYDLAKDTYRAAKIGSDAKELRNELSYQIERLDRQIEDARSKVRAATAWVKMRDQMKHVAQQECDLERGGPVVRLH
jgi:hypothetical protein